MAFLLLEEVPSERGGLDIWCAEELDVTILPKIGRIRETSEFYPVCDGLYLKAFSGVVSEYENPTYYHLLILEKLTKTDADRLAYFIFKKPSWGDNEAMTVIIDECKTIVLAQYV